MTIPCPTCEGKGTVPIQFEGSMCYCGTNGESVPQEPCRSCGGSGEVDDPDHGRRKYSDQELNALVELIRRT